MQQEESRIPKTAREAYIIELIGDLGVVHDMIKTLPEEINQATAGSLELIAQSVEEAEKTASELVKGVERQKDIVLDNFKEAVKSSLDEYAKETLAELEKSVTRLQNRIEQVEIADPKSRKINFILSITLAVTLVLSGAALYGIYKGAQSTIEDLNSIIISQEKALPK